MKLQSISFILLCFSLLFTTQSMATGIKFGKKISKKQIKIMKNDLSVLENLSFEDSTGFNDILKVLELNHLTNDSVVNWLEDRIQVVISNTPFSDMKIKVVDNNYSYPYNRKDERPVLENLLETKKIQATTVMSNIGTAIYYAGKQKNVLWQMKIKARGLKKKQNITSPRTGIIMIGDGHFMDRFDIVKDDKNALPNSLNRLSTFFHEARHSDGHAKSLGFFHAKCPKGHDFEFLNACDRNLNGPYTVGALVKREFIRNCDSCSVPEKEALKGSYLDSLNRVIKETTIIDTKGEGSLESYKMLRDTYITIINYNIYKGKELEVIKAKLAEVEQKIKDITDNLGKETVVPSIFWDAAPEGKRL